MPGEPTDPFVQRTSSGAEESVFGEPTEVEKTYRAATAAAIERELRDYCGDEAYRKLMELHGEEVSVLINQNVESAREYLDEKVYGAMTTEEIVRMAESGDIHDQARRFADKYSAELYPEA